MNYGKFPLVGLTLTALCACAPTAATLPRPLADYPFHHQAFDLKVAWEVASAPGGVTISGVARNVRYVQVRDMEVTVLLLDASKKVLAKGRSFAFPYRLNLDETGTFHVGLGSAAIGKGDLLQFVIQYQAMEDGSNSFNWISSFTVEALSGTRQNK